MTLWKMLIRKVRKDVMIAVSVFADNWRWSFLNNFAKAFWSVITYLLSAYQLNFHIEASDFVVDR